jgi:hypothetical protein
MPLLSSQQAMWRGPPEAMLAAVPFLVSSLPVDLWAKAAVIASVLSPLQAAGLRQHL